MCVIVKKHAIFKHKHTQFPRTYISYENISFSKNMANYDIFILVSNVYIPILNIKAVMLSKLLNSTT